MVQSPPVRWQIPEMSPHQANMHSLVVMPGSWKGRCAFLAIAAVVSGSVLHDGQVQEEVYGRLTTAKMFAFYLYS